MGTDDIHVGTRQSESINTIGLKTCHKVFVDQSSIDHCHYFERLGICDPPSVHHLALYAELCTDFCCSSSAAVHQYLSSFYGREVFQ